MIIHPMYLINVKYVNVTICTYTVINLFRVITFRIKLPIYKVIIVHLIFLREPGVRQPQAAHVQFLEIALVCMSICVCLCLCPPPRKLATSGVIYIV